MPNDNFIPNRPNTGDTTPPPAYRSTIPATPPPHQPESTDTSGPLTDREVPVPVPHHHETPVIVQAWLDGEATTSMVQATQGGDDAVDLWTRINTEAEQLKTRTTPLYVHKRIMESLPNDLHRVNRPWYRRSVALNPITLVAAAAALLGVGAFVARVATH